MYARGFVARSSARDKNRRAIQAARAEGWYDVVAHVCAFRARVRLFSTQPRRRAVVLWRFFMSFSYSDLISEYKTSIEAYRLRVSELRALLYDSDIVWNRKSYRRIQRRINSLNSSIESMNYAVSEMSKYT